jgi:hypothetical protein
VRGWKKQETGEKYVRICCICCNHQHNGGWWKGREWMCLSGHRRLTGRIRNKNIFKYTEDRIQVVKTRESVKG